jgi:hypothetical protein
LDLALFRQPAQAQIGAAEIDGEENFFHARILTNFAG